MIDYESDSIDGVQPRQIAVPAEESERLQALLAEVREVLDMAREWIEDELDWRDAYLKRCEPYQKVISAIAKLEGEEQQP